MSPLSASSVPGVGRFLEWWGRELISLIPAAWRLRSSTARQLAVVISQDGPRLYDERGRRSQELTLALDRTGREAEADALLATLSRYRPQRQIVLRLPHGSAFQRVVTLPASCASDAARIMCLDLERATPFHRKDVLAAHHILPETPTPGKITVRQLVLKRATLLKAQEVLTRNGLEPDRVECCAEDGQTPVPLDFLDWDRTAPAKSRIALPRVLLLTACLLAAAATTIMITRLEQSLADVADQITAARNQVTSAAADRIQLASSDQTGEALMALRVVQMSKALLIDQLTKLLPDSDYLTALRIDGADIELSGFSASTAALIPLIERSKFLVGVALTAPAVLDARSGRERFTLRARIVEMRPTGRAQKG